MKKIFCISAFVLECLFSWGQCLTSDYAAFEHLMNDVNSIVDSCLSDSTVDYSADYSIKVWIDSCGFIRKTEVKKIGEGPSPQEQNICIDIEQAILNTNRQYDIYIEDYHLLKDRYWKLREYATYYIRCSVGGKSKHTN